MIIKTNPHFSQYRVSRDSLSTQQSNPDREQGFSWSKEKLTQVDVFIQTKCHLRVKIIRLKFTLTLAAGDWFELNHQSIVAIICHNDELTCQCNSAVILDFFLVLILEGSEMSKTIRVKSSSFGLKGYYIHSRDCSKF